jgi:hypothetical protein
VGHVTIEHAETYALVALAQNKFPHPTFGSQPAKLATVSSRAMPAQTCPACNTRAPRLLDQSSLSAYVNYHQCDTCRHIWLSRKVDASFVGHVTPLEDSKRRAPHGKP